MEKKRNFKHKKFQFLMISVRVWNMKHLKTSIRIQMERLLYLTNSMIIK